MRRSQSPDGKSLKSRRSGHTSRESAPLLAKVLGGGEDDERSTLVEAPELPALPTGSRAARALGEWAFIHNKAKDALEKLRKWEWAFEKEQAYPPTAEDKAFSNTYSTYSSKYVKYVTQLRAMEQEEDDGAGVGVERAAPISISDDAAFDGSYGSTGYGGSSSVDSGGGGGGGGGGRRAAVSTEAASAATLEDGEPPDEFVAPVIAKSKEAETFLQQACSQALLFAALGEVEFETVIGAMFEVKANAGQLLIREGEEGDNFYVIQSGSYSVLFADPTAKPGPSLGPGDSFGELALLYNTPRNASVKCTQSGVLWGLDRHSFRNILMSKKQSADQAMLDFLRSISLFSSLTTEQLVRMASVVQRFHFQGGEYVVRQGDHADSIFLIMEGSVVCTRRGDSGRYPLHTGDVFGESALNEEIKEEERVRRADVIADGAVTVVQLMQGDFHKLLGSSLEAVTSKNSRRKIIGSVKFDGAALTALLSVADVDKLVEALVEETYEDGETIIEEGATGDTFYILRSGSASVSTKQRSEVATLGEGDFFGEMALLRAEPRSATISAIGRCKCLTLNRITFTRLLGPLQERLALDMDRRDLQTGSMKYTDLEPIKLIGVGSFSSIRLVLHRPTNTTYVLKRMFRAQIIAQNQISHVLSEAALLKRCAHPFLPRLAATYKDADHLYMLIDYVPGGELYTVLRTQNTFLEPVAAFYAAIVVLVFEYLHDRHIAYRDLKPENLLFDASGYLKLVDFGFAKEISTKTWTLCGTPEYLAPEIILNKGHDGAVDWWALGILIYEMLVGATPFAADGQDPMQIYKKILKGSLPERRGQKPLPPDSKQIVTGLLSCEPSERLGCQKLGTEEVKRANFFSKLNWHRLEKKLIQPPYVPEIADAFDVSNFDCEGLETPRYEHKATTGAATAHHFEDF